MTTLYVRSTDGSDADNGTTWVLAKASIAGAAAIDVAGDVIYVSDAHAEVQTTAQSWAFAATRANPVRIIGGDDAAEPPTSAAATWTFNLNASAALTISGCAYIYGGTITLGATGGGTGSDLTIQPAVDCFLNFENCKFRMAATSAGATLSLGSASATQNETRLENTTIRFGALGQLINIGGKVIWNQGGIEAGGTALDTLFMTHGGGRGADWQFTGVDLSGLGSTCDLVDNATNTGSTSRFVLRNCRLPDSWTGTVFDAPPQGGNWRSEIHNTDFADTTYSFYIEDYFGTIVDETTVVRTGGASDGTTPISWRLTTANLATAFQYPTLALETPELPARWNTTLSSLTVTVEILHDSVTALTNKEVWLELAYLGTAGRPLALFKEDDAAGDNGGNLLAAAADQTASSAAWTTTGLTNPHKQKLAVTVTPAEIGYLQARVHLSKSNYTVFVDPLLTVS